MFIYTHIYILCDANHDFEFEPSFSSREEEIFDPVSSFLEGLFDNSEQLSNPSVKQERLESFHFFDDVFLDKSRTVSVFDHEIGDKHEEEIQAWKSLITCKVRKRV